jgi:hypothetical protein
VTRRYDVTCNDCMWSPPCVPDAYRRIPCDDCDRHFRSRVNFNNHKLMKLGGTKKTLCAGKRYCAKCGALITHHKHECKKIYCKTCERKREIGHPCYVAPLKNNRPPSERVLYVFYDFEKTQNLRYTQTATLHIPNLVCIQQFCVRCESETDVTEDCFQCGKRKHWFWEDPLGDIA